MTTDTSDPSSFATLASSPEGQQLFAEILANCRSIAKKVGGAQPVIDMLCGSFAMIGNPKTRSEYDELRRQVVQYLQTIDDGDLLPPDGARATFSHSPEVSSNEVKAFAEKLLSTSGAKHL